MSESIFNSKSIEGKVAKIIYVLQVVVLEYQLGAEGKLKWSFVIKDAIQKSYCHCA